MSYAGSSQFINAVQQAFSTLVTAYGFEVPAVEDLGREVYVLYHRGTRTVSVSMESGGRPIVELFYPSLETGEAPVAWARRNGMDRARRILRLHAADGHQPSVEAQLESAFCALEDEEIGFLRSV